MAVGKALRCSVCRPVLIWFLISSLAKNTLVERVKGVN